MKNQHQTKKLGLKKINITLLTTHKLSQIQGGRVETAGVHGCQSGGCRSYYERKTCITQIDPIDSIDNAYA